MFKKLSITKKVIFNAAWGISIEILYALIVMAVAFLVCLVVVR